MHMSHAAGLMRAVVLLMAALTAQAGATQPVQVEDFSYEGSVPTKWRILDRRSKQSLPLPAVLQRDDDYVEVVTRNGERMLRVYTRNETVQVARLNGEDGFDWDTRRHPVLMWRWRAERLPEGARETSNARNDTGAALYVTFDCNDWLRRPCTIKYTYSSTLPVGATARYGQLRVMVVSSALDGLGRWIDIRRDVRADFRALFGKEAPARPAFIMVWGDTDNTKGTSEAYFDAIAIADSG